MRRGSYHPSGKPQFFAQKFIRLLTKTASATELGPGVCWMLAVIASQEDAKRYTGPARFYYDQLMPLCGFNSRKQLRAAITKAVAQGWLEYTPGAKGVPGRFSVCIPEAFAELQTTACDETSSFELKLEPELRIVAESICSTNSEPEAEPNTASSGNCKGRTSIPIPDPDPKLFEWPNEVRLDSRFKAETTPTNNLDPPDALLEQRAKKYERTREFQRWYEAYPKKAKPDAAAKAYVVARKKLVQRLGGGSEADAFLLDRANAFASSPVGRGSYCPHPASWLNAGSYDDDPAVWNQGEGKTPPAVIAAPRPQPAGPMPKRASFTKRIG